MQWNQNRIVFWYYHPFKNICMNFFKSQSFHRTYSVSVFPFQFLHIILSSWNIILCSKVIYWWHYHTFLNQNHNYKLYAFSNKCSLMITFKFIFDWFIIELFIRINKHWYITKFSNFFEKDKFYLKCMYWLHIGWEGQFHFFHIHSYIY